MPTFRIRALARLGACLAAASLGGAATSAGQTGDEAAQFGEIVDVQLVNVEAWVTDAAGRPVHGLTTDDFEVLEDGEPVAISHFSEIRGHREPLFPGAPPQFSGATRRSAGGVESPAHLVVYVDDLHLGPRSRARLLGDLRGFLAEGTVPPERVLIVRQTRDLLTEASLGSTLNQLDDALSRLEKPSALGAQTAQEKRLVLARLQQLWEESELQPASRPDPGQAGPCGDFVRRAVPEVEQFAATSRNRIEVTLDHLGSLASYLAGLPGPKTLLYLSDGLETMPGTDLLTFVNGVCPGGQQESLLFIPSDELRQPMRRLTRHANANRVTIYALQAFGLNPGMTGGAEMGSVEMLATAGLDAAIRSHERDGLALLADQTGGRAVFNRNRFESELAQIGREMTGYYSLAYEPPHGGDGAEHEIEVRVPGTGLRVRHRRGYRDKGPDARMAERLESALYLGLMSNPLRARLGAGTITGSDGGAFLLPLHVLVPRDAVAFLPAAEGELGRVRVWVVGRDRRNRRVVSREELFRIARPPAEAIDTLDLVVTLEVPAGPMVLAVGLRDEATGEAAYLSTTIAVGDPGSARR